VCFCVFVYVCVFEGGNQATRAFVVHISKILHSISTSSNPLFSKVTDVDLETENSFFSLKDYLQKLARVGHIKGEYGKEYCPCRVYCPLL
jgi:hypothetical protein